MSTNLVYRRFTFNSGAPFDCYIYVTLNERGYEEFWFKGSDVASYLEYKRPRKAVTDNVDLKHRKYWRDLIGENKTLQPIATATASVRRPRRRRIAEPFNWRPNTIFISEVGFNSLTLRSRKQKSKALSRWVRKEVLPTLRKKTDGYETLASLDDTSVDDGTFVSTRLDSMGNVEEKISKKKNDDGARTTASELEAKNRELSAAFEELSNLRTRLESKDRESRLELSLFDAKFATKDREKSLAVQEALNDQRLAMKDYEKMLAVKDLEMKLREAELRAQFAEKNLERVTRRLSSFDRKGYDDDNDDEEAKRDSSMITDNFSDKDKRYNNDNKKKEEDIVVQQRMPRRTSFSLSEERSKTDADNDEPRATCLKKKMNYTSKENRIACYVKKDTSPSSNSYIRRFKIVRCQRGEIDRIDNFVDSYNLMMMIDRRRSLSRRNGNGNDDDDDDYRYDDYRGNGYYNYVASLNENSRSDRKYGWFKGSKKLFDLKCFNPIIVWNRAKQSNPHFFYGVRFVQPTNTEFHFLTEREIRDKFRDNIAAASSAATVYSSNTTSLLGPLDETECVARCFTPDSLSEERCFSIIKTTIDSYFVVGSPSTLLLPSPRRRRKINTTEIATLSTTLQSPSTSSSFTSSSLNELSTAAIRFSSSPSSSFLSTKERSPMAILTSQQTVPRQKAITLATTITTATTTVTATTATTAFTGVSAVIDHNRCRCHHHNTTSIEETTNVDAVSCVGDKHDAVKYNDESGVIDEKIDRDDDDDESNYNPKVVTQDSLTFYIDDDSDSNF